MAYSGNSDPRGAVTMAAGWRDFIAAQNAADADAIVQAYAAFAGVVHYDPNLAVAQAVLETGHFTSPAWLNRRNPAGLGITGDSVAGPDFGTIERGVQAHLALLNCYYGNGTDPWGVLTGFGMGGMTLGKTTLSGMNGVWAVPGTTYGQEIADIANGVGGGKPVPPPPPAVGVYGEDIARAALKHLGQTHESDALNGDHPVSMFCEADVEDWCAEAGVPQPPMPTAATNADRLPLSTTFPAPMGALVFFKGPGWSKFGHVGVSYSDAGGTISGLQSVVVSSGWQATAMGCVGWRFPDGVTAAHPPQPGSDPGVYYADGNPFGAIPMRDVFWARFDALNTMGTPLDHPGAINPQGLALPMLGYPVAAETTLPNGRRVQRFERGWLGTQPTPDPWDVAVLPPSEVPQ